MNGAIWRPRCVGKRVRLLAGGGLSFVVVVAGGCSESAADATVRANGRANGRANERTDVRADGGAAVDGRVESVPLAAAVGGDGPRFERLAPEVTGITFENRFDWEHPRKHLYPHGYAGGGVAVGDYDDDGRPDLYLVSQTGRDALYRQVDDFRFEDVTDAAGLGGGAGRGTDWGTGAAFADVDDDGDLDLYVCNYDAPNLLYLNAGDGTFRESAATLGLDFHGASVMASFADYDLDGDLDLYLLTNRLYPGGGRDVPRTRQVNGRVAIDAGYEEAFAIQERPIGGEIQKFIVKAGQRDRLYRNDGGTFTDVSHDAGITGNHPGLSATWWDFDDDGRPDLYVGNDFWDADRLYHNEGDGTFIDVLAERLPHTPWFTMGADHGDLDNDGRVDFIAADMSATSHFMSKLMMGDMNDSRWFLESAEPRQYMRNAVYLNTGTERFMEVAFLANLASTDWTWSVKLGDLDNDGRLDAFFTNGTANHSFDPDLTRALRDLEAGLARRRVDPRRVWQEQWDLYRTVPLRREVNLAMRNHGELRFTRVSEAWGLDHEGISFGAVLADLDRDGDLDIVVSNVDDPVSVYRNRSTDGHGLLVRLVGVDSNRDGIGATIRVETGSGGQVRYLAPTGGYMSANEPVVHFGLGDDERVDRLTVRWPSGRVQELEDVATNRMLTLTEPSASPPTPPVPASPIPTTRAQFTEIAAATGLQAGFTPERPYPDYQRQPLLPGKLSQLGPGMAWADANGDGLDDLFVGGPAGQSGRLFINEGAGRFRATRAGPWIVHKSREDLAPLWLDVDADGDLDLYVASGSVEGEPGDAVFRDRLYLNDGLGGFTNAPAGTLPEVADSTGVVVAGDYDADGDLDLFIGARVVPGRYPETPTSRLLRNDDGRFVDVTSTVAPGLADVGLVTGALFSDASGDGRCDLLVTLEWGPVAFWRNVCSAADSGVSFVDETAAAGLATRTGWWSSVAGGDLDHDGDIDYVVMNTGLNTKYVATPEKPAYLFYGSFDGGRRRLLEAKPEDEHLLPVRGRSCSMAAMPFVGAKMPTYRAFAAATLDDIYSGHDLETALTLTANHLESGVLINETPPGGRGPVRFVYRTLPRIAQAAPGFGVVVGDLDGDANADVYIVQNAFWREPETGRWDGGISQLLAGDGRGHLRPVPAARSGLVVAGDATGLTRCDVDGDGRPDLIVTRNDRPLLVFRNEPADGGDFLAVRLDGPPGNPTGVGALVTVVDADGRIQTEEVYAGSGYLSQSSPCLYFGRGRDGAHAPIRVHVRWPDGAKTVHVVGDADRLVIPAPGR